MTPKEHPPIFSVVIPCYNAAATLPSTLDSVLQQTFQNFEVLVVDDGSQDHSREIAEAYSRRDSRIRLLPGDHKGVSRARNAGVAASSGRWIAFLDADDLWLPEKLHHHAEQFLKDPELGIAFAKVRFMAQDGTPLAQESASPPSRVAARDLLASNPTTTTSNLAARRQVLEETGGFDESMSFSEDLEWLLRVRCTTRWQIGGLDRTLMLYRTSENGLSSRLEAMEDGWQSLIDRAKVYAPDLVASEYPKAQAFHLRYLARRALRLHLAPSVARQYLRRALESWPRLFFKQPVQVISIWTLSYLCWTLPYLRWTLPYLRWTQPYLRWTQSYLRKTQPYLRSLSRFRFSTGS